jgi:hypothetical protein
MANGDTIQDTTDEMWTTQDGRKIAVGDMEESHVRNVLRMILRKRRERFDRHMAALEQEMITSAFADDIDPQVLMNAQHYRDLADPDVFFPLLDGGVFGSPELQKKYGKGL